MKKMISLLAVIGLLSFSMACGGASSEEQQAVDEAQDQASAAAAAAGEVLPE